MSLARGDGTNVGWCGMDFSLMPFEVSGCGKAVDLAGLDWTSVGSKMFVHVLSEAQVKDRYCCEGMCTYLNAELCLNT